MYLLPLQCRCRSSVRGCGCGRGRLSLSLVFLVKTKKKQAGFVNPNQPSSPFSALFSPFGSIDRQTAERDTAATARTYVMKIPIHLQGGGDGNNRIDDYDDVELGGRKEVCFGYGHDENDEVEVESSESSSIGVAGESSDLSGSSDAEEEEVDSGLRGSFVCLEGLEDSLPIKRGLSNFFNGKSKSFSNLSSAAAEITVNDLVKPENPFNKKRRIIMASKSSWQRRASCTSLIMSASLRPLRTLKEDEDDEDEDEDEEDEGTQSPVAVASLASDKRKLKTFRSNRSFSLSDLQQRAQLS